MVIDVPPSVPAELRDLAVVRCDAVLGRGRCRIAEDGRGLPGSYRVRIVLSSDQEQAHIELRARDDSTLATRDVAFLARDPHEDRWRSLGVVVAALVVLEETRTSVASGEVPSRPPPPGAPPALIVALEIAAAASNHSAQLPPTPSGVLVLNATYWPMHLVGLVGVRYGRALQGVEHSSQWLAVNAGFGTRIGSRMSRLGLDLRALVEWQRVFVAAQDAAAGRYESLQSSRFGMRVSLQPSVRLSTRISLIAAAEVAVIRPEVLIDVRDQLASRLPAATAGALAGVRVEL